MTVPIDPTLATASAELVAREWSGAVELVGTVATSAVGLAHAAGTAAVELAHGVAGPLAERAAEAAGHGAHEGASIIEPYLMHRPALDAFLEARHLPLELVPFFYSAAITLIVGLVCWLGTRNLSRVPGPLQNLLETAYLALEEFIVGMMGPRGRDWVFLIGSCFTYILLCNLFGLLPQGESPTSNINQTVALALTVFFFIHYAGFRSQGLHYIHHFMGDIWWLAPIFFVIHVIGELARPLSLAMRLFGNIRGEDITLCILFFLVPFLVPLPMIFLMAFTALIQAMVFSMLSMAYISGALPEEGSSHH